MTEAFWIILAINAAIFSWVFWHDAHVDRKQGVNINTTSILCAIIACFMLDILFALIFIADYVVRHPKFSF